MVAIMNENKTNDELFYIDYIQINSQLMIIFIFRSFKLIVLIFISSYIVGIFWFIMCNFNKVISKQNAIDNFKADEFDMAFSGFTDEEVNPNKIKEAKEMEEIQKENFIEYF